MILHLLRNRYRPPLGSSLWLKYWLKRIYHVRGLMVAWVRQRRFAKRCNGFGAVNALSPITTHGSLSRLSIGNNCAIGRVDIMLHDDVTIGDRVAINDGCCLLTGSHDVNDPNWSLLTGPIQIERYAWVATRAMILPGVTIGEGAVVAAGAVVPQSVPPYTVVAGNPAKPVRERGIREFKYSPSDSFAVFEAWLGPPAK